MTEALRAVINHGFDNLGIVKIEADVFIGNAPGIALLESVGFVKEGTVRRVHPKRGRWVDAHLYGIVPEDLTAAEQD
jgi:RimJ/RimL family protein N-acetyltransferase